MNRKALIAEAIGTFALIFIGAGSGALGVGGLVGVALAHGLTVMIFAYSYGPISGSHINPAVTFVVAISGKISWRDAPSFWMVQLVGASLGAATLFYIFGGGQAMAWAHFYRQRLFLLLKRLSWRPSSHFYWLTLSSVPPLPKTKIKMPLWQLA